MAITIYEKIDNEVLSGFVRAAEVPHLTLTWKGARIPFDLWRKIVGFMRAQHQVRKSESTGRLLYHPADRVWRFVVKAQRSVGLSVSEVEGECMEMVQMLQLGYEQFGTVHHHCSAGAFQSGTDSRDEMTSPGLHITIGKIDKPTVDLHARLVFRATQYDVPDLTRWIETPEPQLTGIPEALQANIRGTVALHHLTHADSDTYPRTWLDQCLPPLPVATETRYQYQPENEDWYNKDWHSRVQQRLVDRDAGINLVYPQHQLGTRDAGIDMAEQRKINERILIPPVSRPAPTVSPSIQTADGGEESLVDWVEGVIYEMIDESRADRIAECTVEDCRVIVVGSLLRELYPEITRIAETYIEKMLAVGDNDYHLEVKADEVDGLWSYFSC
jgi:hypothetical protein